jgi:ABC-type lipoprotein release transport system permease subunit
MYSFLGSLLEGFIGTIIGFALGYIVALIIPSDGGFIYSDLNKVIGLVAVLFVCWFIGVVAGGITTIKPLIK